MSSIKRTPSSASRRPIRHCHPKPAVSPRLYTVPIQSTSRFTRQVEQLGRRLLHPVSRFQGVDHALQLARTGTRPQVLLVRPCHHFELQALELVGRNASLEIGHRVPTGTNPSALKGARQKIASPHLGSGVRCERRDDNEGGQRFVLGPQSVTQPGPHAGSRERPRPAVHSQGTLIVIAVIRVHRADHRQFVGHPTHMRKQITDHRPGPATWPEPPVGSLQIGMEGSRLALPVVHRDGLAVFGVQVRLVVERFDVRNAPRHIQEYHPPGARGEVIALRGGRRGERPSQRRHTDPASSRGPG